VEEEEGSVAVAAVEDTVVVGEVDVDVDVVVAVVEEVEAVVVDVEEGVRPPAAARKAAHLQTRPALTSWMTPCLSSRPNWTGMLLAVASVTVGRAVGSAWKPSGREASTASRMASMGSPSGRWRQTAARWSPAAKERARRRRMETHIFFFFLADFFFFFFFLDGLLLLLLGRPVR
jgi:hypothetical protein